jgi:hypothetical protein
MKPQQNQVTFKTNKDFNSSTNLITSKTKRKQLSINIASLSTTGNLKSLNSKPTFRQHNSKNLENVSENTNTQSGRSKIRGEIFKNLEKNINEFSPAAGKNQHVRFSIHGGLPKTARSRKILEKSAVNSPHSTKSVLYSPIRLTCSINIFTQNKSKSRKTT